MSQISLNRKKYSLQNSVCSRMITQVPTRQQQKQNFNIDQNINQNLSSLKDTINMLKQYQKICIQKEDFMKAQQTKTKLQFLQQQQKSILKQRQILKQHQNIETICKQGEQQVQAFQQYWDNAIKNLIQQLKQVQANYIQQQSIELNQYKQRLSTQEAPKIKYSSKVLQLRKNLTNLIKNRKYKQAEEVKNNLRSLELQCEEGWKVKNQQKQNSLILNIEKKQTAQLKALRIKLEAVFNEKIKQRDQKFQILLKKNRKRRVQSSKSKINKNNQSVYSRSRAQSRVVLGNSKLSNFNCSNK